MIQKWLADMDVTPLVSHNAQIVQSYAGGVFKVSGQIYDGAVLVTSEETLNWNISSFDDLCLADFENLPKDIDVVLLGTGKTMSFLPLEIRSQLRSLEFSVDTMDTGAACRTYNVLMAEGRRVAAVLFPYL